MEVYEATMTSKGQVTLPVRLRSALGLKSGDTIVFRKDENGVQVEARTDSLAALRGIVRAAPGKVDARQVETWLRDARSAGWRSR